MESKNPYQSPGNDNPPQTNPHTVAGNIESAFIQFERQFRVQYPWMWFATLVAPVVLTAIVLGVLWLTIGWAFVVKVVSHAGLTFFVFGRFIILLGMEGAAESKVSLEPLQLFAMVTYMDFITALFVTFHMGFLFKVPWVGEKIAALVYDGKFLMDSQPWIKRIAWFGLVAFVIFPTSTTGSIGGSIFGRLLGMGRLLTLTGVLIGSVLGNGIMYVFSRQINQYVNPENNWLKIAGIIIIVVVFFLLERRYQAVRKKYAKTPAEKESEAPPNDSA